MTLFKMNQIRQSHRVHRRRRRSRQLFYVFSMITLCTTWKDSRSETEIGDEEVKESYGYKECYELGFNRESLTCESCELLKKYVGHEETVLINECKECCTISRIENSIRVRSGILEVCKWKLGRFEEVKQFIEKRLEKYPQLKHVHKQGQAPQIRLLDDDENEIEVIR